MKEKANYCLNCLNKPCQKACPLNNNIPEFIKCIKDDNIKGAYEILSETTCLSSICGRICLHNKQCQGYCTRKFKGKPVSIGELEAYVSDEAIKNNWFPLTKPKNDKKIAIIGSGPSSLTCAYFLDKEGFNVTIYEKYNDLGGILNHSIPEFRIDKNIVKETIKRITKNISIKCNKELGNNLDINELLNNYDAIYIGIGANISKKIFDNIPGIYGANELLEYNNHQDYNNKKIIVNGGGNVAMDIARTIKRKNPKNVTIIYRRSEIEMPAETNEIIAAKKEGIEFVFQTNIIEPIYEEKLKGLRLIKTELINDGSGRKKPVNIIGTEYDIECDYLINAIGSSADISLLNSLNIELENNKIKINEKNQTSNEKIFAGGDITNTPSTIAFAASSGRNAAYGIMEYINEVSK